MNTRLLVYVTLALLGAGALAGVTIALGGAHYDMGPSALFMLLVAAIGAAALMLVTHWLGDKTTTRVLATLWTTIVLVVALIELMIWLEFTGSYWQGVEAVFIGAWIVGFAGLCGAVALHHAGNPSRRWASLGALVALALAVVGWAIGLAESFGQNYQLAAFFFAAGWLSLLHGAIAAALWAGFDPRAPTRPWRWLGLAFNAIAAALTCTFAWNGEDELIPSFVGFAGAAIVMGHANLVFMARLRTRVRWLRPLTVAATAAAVALLGYWMIHERSIDAESAFARTAIVSAIVAATLTVAVLVLAWAGKVAPRSVHTYLDDARLRLTCPRCDTLQHVGPGETACAGCGLRFHLKVEEPRCPQCNYLLYHFAGESCLECGHVIAMARGEACEPAAEQYPAAASQRRAL